MDKINNRIRIDKHAKIRNNASQDAEYPIAKSHETDPQSPRPSWIKSIYVRLRIILYIYVASRVLFIFFSAASFCFLFCFHMASSSVFVLFRSSIESSLTSSLPGQPASNPVGVLSKEVI
jgi:hypothetical protein